MNPVDTGRQRPTGVVNPPQDIPTGMPGQSVPGTFGTPQTVPVMRPSFLQAFLSNLGPSLMGGMAPQPGSPFGTGLGGAFQGMEEDKQRRLQQQNLNRQFGLQQQAAQREATAQASTQAYQTAETSRLQQLTPFDVQQKELETNLLKAQVGFFGNPTNITGAVQDATKSLGPLSPPEQAQIDAASKEAQLTRKFDPINAAVKNISQDRIVTQRGADTSAYKGWRTQFIRQMGREPNAQEIINFNTAGQTIRMQGLENLRQDNYLDTSVPGGSVGAMTAGEFASANKADPGRFVKYNGTVANTLKAQSFISDIRDGMKQMQAAVDDPNFTLSSGGRALMSLANKNPQTAVSTVMSGLAAQNLSDPEQNYLIAHASLLERAMSLRSLQGQGAGSDQQRAAIAGLVPSFATADRNMATKLLKTLGNNVDNVQKAFPKIGSGQPNTGQPPAGATMRVPGSDGKMHWSDGKQDLGVIQ